MPDCQHILYALDGDGIATITFDEPERLNAFSWPMMEKFKASPRGTGHHGDFFAVVNALKIVP